MFPKIIGSIRLAGPVLCKGSITNVNRLPIAFLRNYRNRPTLHQEDGVSPIVESVDNAKEEEVKEAVDINPIPKEGKEEEPFDGTTEEPKSTEEDTINEEEFSLANSEMYNTPNPEDSELPSIDDPRYTKNVTDYNYEDTVFKLKDRYEKENLDDDVDEDYKHPARTQTEEFTYMNMKDAKTFFDRVSSLQNCDIDYEMEPSYDFVNKSAESRNETSEKEKGENGEIVEDVHHGTWFNFMSAKEFPLGLHESYDHDQIFNSLEFDLFGRNADKIYKYEKDDMLLTEDLLKHTKLPPPLEPPTIKAYPQLQEYANRVTQAVDRNGHYTMEEKQEVLRILQELGSYESETDDSPKMEFKRMKYL